MKNAGTPPPLIEARDLHRAYRIGPRAVPVLRGVHLRVARGEFVVILGASGAGKTTLLNLLGGLDTPTSGAVLFEGRDLSRMSAAERARLRNRSVGFVFQAYHLLPELDALENVMVPARVAGLAGRALCDRAGCALERVGLGERLHHRPAELSGGEQQRVAIARALVNRPGLLLADEPTGNLDSATGGDIMRLLASLHASGDTTLVVVTHDAGIASAGERVVEMIDGRVRADEPVREDAPTRDAEDHR